MRVFAAFVLTVTVFASGAAEAQGTQSYAPQTWTLQTHTPQTYAPQTHAPQTWTPQVGQSPGRPPRRRLVKCMLSADAEDYCVFYTDRVLRRGSPCSCDGGRGSTN